MMDNGARLLPHRQTMKERCVAGGQDQDMVAAVQCVINPLLLHIKSMDGVDTAVSAYHRIMRRGLTCPWTFGHFCL